jgi:mono/diheme cytochrome c family protein
MMFKARDKQLRMTRISRAIAAYSGSLLIAAVYFGSHGAASQTVETRSAQTGGGAQTARAVLDRYCVTCHNQRLKTAGLMLDGLDVDHVSRSSAEWEKVARKLRTGEMPPPGMPRPDSATSTIVSAYLENALDAAALANPNPGRVPVHRLNRTEYTNAVRDLLALELDGKSLLWADEPDQEGFDNVASVLSISPALLEGYISSARRVSRLAIGDPTINPVTDEFKILTAVVQDDRMGDDLPFGSQGGTSIPYLFPLDGEYQIKVRLKRQLYLYIMGMGEPHQLEIRLDRALVKRFTIGGQAFGMTNPESFAGNTQGDPEFEEYMHTADDGLEVRIPVEAGRHEVSVSFVRRFWQPEGVLQPPQRGFARTTNELYHGYPAVDSVSIGGPYNAVATTDSPSRRKLFACRPKNAADEEPCARNILVTLAKRAYRRPVTEDEANTLMAFYKEGRATGSFDKGIQRGVERILAAPSFILRIEGEPPNAAPGTVYRLSDLDLASRLSFFLWGSVPDEELLNAAIAGRLRQPAGLEQQVRRMLADPKAKSLVDGFVAQWLQLGKLKSIVPDAERYPEFDENLRDAMRRETEEFVADQLRGNRSVLEMLSANYSFLNERLARHYGVHNVYGERFRKVTFNDDTRGGLLGQASVLTVTSYPNRTSVVLRGKWLLNTFLGGPPPPPPADVPSLKDPGQDGQPRSLRDRMEQHRKNPACAGCHRRMDPLGFSLENFDALGKWRTIADGETVDASASLPDGTRFSGIAGLRGLLIDHKEDFVRTLSEKMLAYAVGRGIESSDLPTVRKIARDAAAGDYRWESLILSIARSTPFTMGIVKSAPPAITAADRPVDR